MDCGISMPVKTGGITPTLNTYYPYKDKAETLNSIVYTTANTMPYAVGYTAFHETIAATAP